MLHPCGNGLHLPSQRLARGRDLHECAVPGPSRRPPRHRSGNGPRHRRARGGPADPRAHRRLDLQEPAGRQGVAARRCGRLPGAHHGRRPGLGDALQLPDQPRRRHRRRYRGARRGGPPPGARDIPASSCIGRSSESVSRPRHPARGGPNRTTILGTTILGTTILGTTILGTTRPSAEQNQGRARHGHGQRRGIGRNWKCPSTSPS